LFLNKDKRQKGKDKSIESYNNEEFKKELTQRFTENSQRTTEL
jgi:hypothetical protein